jgi:adenylate cyclase
MSDLWRGKTATKARIISGLVLFTYALLHFINIGLGLIDPVWMDRMQEWRQVFTRSILGTLILYTAFAVHIAFALVRLAGRRSLRLPLGELAQITLGLIIPALLIAHIVHTRTAHEIYDVRDEMDYIMVLLHGTRDGWKQSALLLIVWAHGCIGLHFWLRGQAWWRAALPALGGVAVFVPSFALAGFLVEGRRVAAEFANEDTRQLLMERFNFPDWETFTRLLYFTNVALAVFAAILGGIIFYVVVRSILARRRSVIIR